MRFKLLILTYFVLFLGVGSAFANNILLNEIMANPNDNTEWIELYNPTNQTVDLSNWKIKDANSLTSDDLTLTGRLNPLSFTTFDHDKGWLNDSGSEIITLLDNNGQVVDSYQYSGTTKGKTYGRQPDDGNWMANLDPSKGSSNGGSSPTEILIPSPTPTPSSNLTPSPTANQVTSSLFSISNTPSQINSTDIFTVSVNLSLPDNPNAHFYLKGAFKKANGSNYFGLTKVLSNWIKNSVTYSSQFPITTDSFGNWSGNLEIQPDILDSGYEGAGEYLFKVARYTEGGSLTWSNEATIKINAQEIVLDTDDNNVLGLNQTLTNQDAAKPKEQIKPLTEGEKYSLEKYVQVATPSSQTTPSPDTKTEVKGTRRINFLTILGIILVIIGFVPIVYAIYNIFRKRNQGFS